MWKWEAEEWSLQCCTVRRTPQAVAGYDEEVGVGHRLWEASEAGKARKTSSVLQPHDGETTRVDTQMLAQQDSFQTSVF